MLLPAAQIRKSPERGGEHNLSKDKEPVHESAGIGSWNPRFFINLYHPQYAFGPNGKWFCLHGEDEAWPFLDGAQRVAKMCLVQSENFPEKAQGQCSVPTIKVMCVVLFLLFPIHPDAVLLGIMKIEKFTGKSPNGLYFHHEWTANTPTIHWPLSAERSHPESHRPAPCTLPGKQVHSEQTRGLDGGQVGGREGNL